MVIVQKNLRVTKENMRISSYAFFIAVDILAEVLQADLEAGEVEVEEGDIHNKHREVGWLEALIAPGIDIASMALVLRGK